MMGIAGVATKLVILGLAISGIMGRVGLRVDVIGVGIEGKLSVETHDVERASVDFGNTRRSEPMGVLHPASPEDIARVVGAAYQFGEGLRVSARGEAHSTHGQAQAHKGLVIDMRSGTTRRRMIRVWEKERYVDAWGGDTWIDVLNETLPYGLAPKSWTDYLYLTVGGTLSNGGISGQTFYHGPQISNVDELDVVTGKGEFFTCSQQDNAELFHAVLGGLGQFGIITRARIALQPAPHRVRWIRVLYTEFSVFTKDQEYLISLHGGEASERFDYVEGFVIVDEGLINNWRSSFFSSSNSVDISSMNADGGVFYCLEITKNYYEYNADTVDQTRAYYIRQLAYGKWLAFLSIVFWTSSLLQLQIDTAS